MALLQAVADLLFPPLCQVCRKTRDFPLCMGCASLFHLIIPPVCQTCGRPMRGPPDLIRTCASCRHRKVHFLLSRAGGIYEGTLREAILALKFSRCRALAGPLGRLMIGAWTGSAIRVDLIVPVPLHPSRLRERGFNQSELLAREIGRVMRIPVEAGVLRRRQDTVPQSGLPAEERRVNVRGAFEAVRPVPPAVLLVDDVISTGSTGSECARVLCENGAGCVMVLVAALSLPPEAAVPDVQARR